MESSGLNAENYHELKTKDGLPVLSSSLLKWGMPMGGGSPWKLKAAHEKLVSIESTPGMRLGTKLHKYVEDSSQFVFQPDWEMSDTIQKIVDYVWGMIPEGNKEDHSFSDLHLYITEAAANIGYGQNWKDETVVRKVVEAGGGYWQFLLEADGKIVVHGDELTKMQGMIRELEQSIAAYILTAEGDNIHRELCIEFTIDDQYPAKAMLDFVEVDHATKTVHITDLKTSSENVANFISSYTYIPTGADIVQQIKPGPYVKYKYFFQEFFYKLAMRAWLEQHGYDSQEYNISFNFVVVENKEPYEVLECHAAKGWMRIAMDEFHSAMRNVQTWFEYDKLFEF